MREKDAQSRFTKWIREEGYNKTAVFELKLSKGNNALPFSCFEPQQLPCLKQAKDTSIFKKLSDMDPSLKPFDCFNIAKAEAYVIAVWYHERKPLIAYWIDVDVFLRTKELSKRKSLTEFTAHKIASKIINF